MRLEVPGFRLTQFRCAAATDGPDLPVPATWTGWPTMGFVLRGLGLLVVDGRRLRADPTHVVLFNQGTEYRVRRHFGCWHTSCAVGLEIEPALLDDSLRGQGLEPVTGGPFEPGVIRLRRTPKAAVLLHAALATAGEPGSKSCPGELEELFLLLLAGVLEELDSSSSIKQRSSTWVVAAAREVLANRYTESLSMGQLAECVGTSKYHLCRAFREQTGMTISRYRHRLRINDSLARIARGRQGLTEIAFDLGFASHSHFTTVFGRELGITPRDFREKVSCW